MRTHWLCLLNYSWTTSNSCWNAVIYFVVPKLIKWQSLQFHFTDRMLDTLDPFMSVPFSSVFVLEIERSRFLNYPAHKWNEAFILSRPAKLLGVVEWKISLFCCSVLKWSICKGKRNEYMFVGEERVWKAPMRNFESIGIKPNEFIFSYLVSIGHLIFFYYPNIMCYLWIFPFSFYLQIHWN